MSAVRKVGAQGAVTIPVALREQLGLQEGTAVSIEPVGDGVLIRPLRALLTKAQRNLALAAINQAYTALQRDPAAWVQELAERNALDGTLLDGLDDVDEAWLAGWLAEEVSTVTAPHS